MTQVSKRATSVNSRLVLISSRYWLALRTGVHWKKKGLPTVALSNGYCNEGWSGQCRRNSQTSTSAQSRVLPSTSTGATRQ